MDNEWKKLERELKILRAKKAAGGFLHPKDQARLEWLEQRLGDAEAVKRIEIDEPVDGGPKVKTSDDHWATEVSEELLKKAEKQKLARPWEQERQGRPEKVIEVKDYQKEARTFRQKGLSNFAVDLTEDLKGGEAGISDLPQEEEEAAEKIDHVKAVYAQDETERLVKKSGKSSNPFALEIDDSFAFGLEKTAESESLVPDTGAKSFGVDVDEETLGTGPVERYEEVNPEAQKLLSSLGVEAPGEEPDLSLGAKTTHSAEDVADGKLDENLVKEAVDYAEKKGLVEREHVWATDENGEEVEMDSLQEEEPTQITGADAGKLPLGASWAEQENDNEKTAVIAPSEDLLAAAVQEELSMPRTSREAEENDKDGYGLELELPDLSEEEPLIPEPPQEPAGPTQATPASVSADVIELAPPEPEQAQAAGGDEDDIPDLSDDAILLEDEPISTRPDQTTDSEKTTKAPFATDADDFWGLGAGTEPEPTTEAGSLQPGSSQDEPLPALSVPSAAPRSAPPSQMSEPKVPAAAPEKQKPASRDPISLMSLFEDAPSPEPEDGILPASSEVADLFQAPVRPSAPKKKGRPNDLKGPRRATVHFKDGVNRRGVIGHIDTDADIIRLEPVTGSNQPPEDLIALSIKAIFLMLPRGTTYPEKRGNKVRLVMMDNRKLEGFTPDYSPNRKAFTLFPAEDRGNIERVIVYNDAVKNIWFD